MENHLIFLTIHASAGGIALISGIIEAFARRHGIFEKLFLVSSIFSAIAGLGMICGICNGFSTKISFAFLGILWLVFSYFLALNIFKGNTRKSRIWFIRGFALVLFFITMRIWRMIFITAGVDYASAYAAAAWTGWVINLLIVEYLILKR